MTDDITLIDGIKCTPLGQSHKILSLLLWGQSGVGKTTLAATAPGKKLWIQFDPGGTNCLQGRDDIMLLDLSGEKHSIAMRFCDDDPLGIGAKILAKYPDIETIVFDSMTMFVGVAIDAAVNTVKSATFSNPGLKGFGTRNALTVRAATVINRLAVKYNRNYVIITHEDSPERDEDGKVLSVPMLLGGKIANQLGLQLREIWCLANTQSGRRIAVAPEWNRAPMKTTMFNPGNAKSFPWRFDPMTHKGDGLSTWVDLWRNTTGKIDLPK